MGIEIIHPGGGSGTGGGSSAWADITGKPATFPPSAHTQDTSTITGLDTALATKLEIVGTNDMGEDITADIKSLLAAGTIDGFRIGAELNEELGGSTEGDVPFWDTVNGVLWERRIQAVSVFWPTPAPITIPLIRKPRQKILIYEISCVITGTCTLSIKIGGVDIPGLAAKSVSSTPADYLADSSGVLSDGDDLITAVLASVSGGASNFDLTVKYRRIRNDA